MPTPQELLTQFNLSPQEAEIYLALLRLGTGGVKHIADSTGKNRTAIYFHLEHLLRKGFIKESRQGRSRRYVPLPPDEVAGLFDRWTTDFKSLVPMLQALSKTSAETPQIEVFISKPGYYRVYDEVSSLPQGSLFRVLEGREAMVHELGLLTQDQWSQFFQRMIERQIETKAIFTEAALPFPQLKLTKKNLELLQQRRWRLRSMSNKMLAFKNMLFIYGDKIALLFPATAFVVTIKHAATAESLAAMFDALYEIAMPRTENWN